MNERKLGAALDLALDRAAGLRDGEVATYIPELAEVDPELFAVAACTVDGELASAGDDRHELTLQSLSKPFVYGWALDCFGIEAVHERVGFEPSGDAFDSIIRVDAANRAHNPMVNAGAIAVSGLLTSGDGSDVADLLSKLSSFAGRELTGVDVPVFLSERGAGHRNRAIAHLLRHLGKLAAPVERALDFYFQQCSVLVTCRDLAAMAATLANGGRQPSTGEQVLPEALVRHVLTVMFLSGLYDYSGGFAVEVGLPSKSGVSGGILAVLPGRLGIAAFSPRLDSRGNSVRGMAAIRQVGTALDLHCFEPVARDPHPDSLPQRETEPDLSPEGQPPDVGAHGCAPSDRPPASDVGAHGCAPSVGAPSVGAPAVRGAPLFETLQAVLEEARSVDGGEVADYIPPLASVSSDLIAIAVAGVDGEEQAVGDADVAFTLQSAANAFGYGLALEACGFEEVHRHVGVEPSGNPFNAIVFDPRGLPFNPLGNAGAITVCALQPGSDATDRLKRLLAGFAAFAGEERMVLDAAVLQAEKRAGERNRAIASLLRNFGHLDEEAAALELYFQQCSIRADCRLLARMGATLANSGIEPRTGRRVLSTESVRRILTLMFTCGLYDEAGRFAFEVGLPAKTGISGGIVAVFPGQMGVAVYAPPVNRHGSSVRGLAMLKALSERLGLGMFMPESSSPGADPGRDR